MSVVSLVLVGWRVTLADAGRVKGESRETASRKIFHLYLQWIRLDMTDDVTAAPRDADLPDLMRTSGAPVRYADVVTYLQADAEHVEELLGDDVAVPPAVGHEVQPRGGATSASAIPLAEERGP